MFGMSVKIGLLH